MKTAIIWPKETFIPNSLYKRYVFMGEVASCLEAYGEVKVLDLSVTNVSKRFLAEFVSECRYIFMPVEVTTVREAVYITEYIRNYSKAKVVVYGTAPIYNPDFFARYFDIVVNTGYWTEILPLIASEQIDKLDINGKLYKLKSVAKELKWYYPDFSKLPMDEYMRISKGEVDLSVQIGCPFDCSFCSEKILHPHGIFVQRPVDNIINFINTYNFSDIFFDATTFTVDRKWVLELAEALIENEKKIRWRTVSRVDQLDDEICEAISQAGCYQIGLGIETLTSSIQKDINKEIGKHITDGINCLKKYHIEPRLFFILGLPGQTLSDVNAALDFVKTQNFKSRWKEYIPLSETSKFTTLDQYDCYRADQFFMHSVEGMNRETYMRVLLKNERN